MVHQFIQWPDEKRCEEISNGFEGKLQRKGLSGGWPGLISVIGGSHIMICKHSEHGEKYINRKGWPSIILQAVCDHEHLFTDVYAGFPGRCHDARVFHHSPLFENAKEYFKNGRFLIADAVYPLHSCIMTPFKDFWQFN